MDQTNQDQEVPKLLIILNVGDEFTFTSEEDAVKFIKALDEENLFPDMKEVSDIIIHYQLKGEDYDEIHCGAGPNKDTPPFNAERTIEVLIETISLLEYIEKHQDINPLVPGDACATMTQRCFTTDMMSKEDAAAAISQDEELPSNLDRLLIMLPADGSGMINEDIMQRGE